MRIERNSKCMSSTQEYNTLLKPDILELKCQVRVLQCRNSDVFPKAYMLYSIKIKPPSPDFFFSLLLLEIITSHLYTKSESEFYIC